ncbi:MAG TPA: hypothetical protein VFT91_11040, partial [Dehalococcoidia bacterium]|nr:hypothetical protein [Dehalococcoidia bacterium]
MRLLSLGLANLRRNRRRTWLTAVSLGLAVFLFTVLSSVLLEINRMVERAGESPVMIVMHKGGYAHDLPERHAGYLRTLPDVKNVVSVVFY